MSIRTLGIDLAKNSFSLHGIDEHGKVVLRKQISRGKLKAFVQQLPVCVIGMEACSGAHYWARTFQGYGHAVKLMAPRFVVPYRKNGKNDDNDAAAICEAVTRPSMRFVAIKDVEQQAVLSLHRVREGLIKERTAQINQLRGLLSEFGIVLAGGRSVIVKEMPRLLEEAENGLPLLARRVLSDVYERIKQLNHQVNEYDREIERLMQENEAAERIQRIPGIGPITATALVASVNDGKQFKNGRQLAAWLGLVPRQNSTGGKIKLGRITKQGDRYLRTLLIHGARSAMLAAKNKQDRVSVWIKELAERRGSKKAAVALAAKLARIIWSMLTTGSQYEQAQ